MIYASVPVVPDRIKHFKEAGAINLSEMFSFFFCKVRDTVVHVFRPDACCNPRQDCWPMH